MKQTFLMTDEALLQVQKWVLKIGACPDYLMGTPTGQVLSDVIGTFGKMIRPSLLLACASFGPDYEDQKEKLYLLGALTELTHLASLVHDDIIDDAPLRRGKSSIQSKYGKDAAVYAGDFLISRINYWEAKEHCNEAAEILAYTVEQMCIGEIGQGACRYRTDVTFEQYVSNIKGKTAALFKAACKIGAMTGGCSEEMIQVMERFGEHLGIMFQLRDDLIDFATDGSKEGKKTHKDFQDGIYTMPVLLAMHNPEAKAKLLPIMELNEKMVLCEDKIKTMEEIVIRYGGVNGTWNEIMDCAGQCFDILDSLEQNDVVKQLRGLLALLIKR